MSIERTRVRIQTFGRIKGMEEGTEIVALTPVLKKNDMFVKCTFRDIMRAENRLQCCPILLLNEFTAFVKELPKHFQNAFIIFDSPEINGINTHTSVTIMESGCIWIDRNFDLDSISSFSGTTCILVRS